MAETAASSNLPSLRELELEELLRKREQQLIDLTAELRALRTKNDETTRDEWHSEQAVSKAAMAVLLPHLVNERNAALGSGHSLSTGAMHSGLVAALRQRTSMLQEENDELYSVLRKAETGRLDEEVKGLRKLVCKLENSLKESNETVKYLTDELEKTTEAFARRPPPRMDDHRSTPPHTSKHRNASPHGSLTSMSSSKPAHSQNGPRLHKKPRTHLSPEPNPRAEDRSRYPPRGHSSESRDARGERVPPASSSRSAGMEIDARGERERDRNERDRHLLPRERERERERGHRIDRSSPRAREEVNTSGEPNPNGLQIRGYARSRVNDGGRSPRRGGGHGGPNGRINGLPGRPDRGLAERMGL